MLNDDDINIKDTEQEKAQMQVLDGATIKVLEDEGSIVVTDASCKN